jgi:hypothetical protein
MIERRAGRNPLASAMGPLPAATLVALERFHGFSRSMRSKMIKLDRE